MASRTLYVFLFLLLALEASMTSALGGRRLMWWFTAPEVRNSMAFISVSCHATQYPQVCYESLSIYADSIAESPVALATHAAEVTAESLGDLLWHLGTRCDHRCRSARPPQEAAALDNCLEWAGYAANLVSSARDELRWLDEGAAAALMVAKPQKWLNKALTDEDTCADGFEEVALGPGSAKEEVLGRVQKVKQHTSNALDLVNSLASHRIPSIHRSFD